jgi:glycosyltransferase involved in cell wall biosynthesis
MPGRVVPYLAPGAPFSTRRFALLSRGSARRLPARPSILAITSELPWPLDRGGHLRSFHLLRGLAADFDLRLVAPIEPGQESLVPALSAEGIRVCAVPVGPRRAPIETLRVFRAALTREPYVLFRRHDRASVRHSVETQVAVNRPDLLYLDHLDSALYADACRVPAILDVHNVYSALVRRTAEEQPHRIVGQYLRGEARLLERAERRAATRAALVTATSDEDCAYYHACGAGRVAMVANGVDCDAYAALPLIRHCRPPVILYVGTMSWGPNAAAARFLATEVLPRVQLRFPDARLRIIGRDPAPDIRALAERPNIEVTGAVPDVIPHLAEAHALAVPLESGGGTRLKILEAFAAGLPVVSTPVGCEGIRAEHGVHLLVSTRERMAQTLVTVLTNRLLAYGLAERARSLVREHYDWRSIGMVARREAHALLRRRSAAHDRQMQDAG